MGMKLYYKVLEVPESASFEEIQTAYRRLAMEYHPDRVPEHLTKLRKDAEEKLKEINEAWGVLRDKARREEYDEELRKTGRTEEGGVAGQEETRADEEEYHRVVAEMRDVERFYSECLNRPAEALRKIAVLVRCRPDMAENPVVIVFRAIAVARNVLTAQPQKEYMPGGRDSEKLEAALGELIRARRAALSADLDFPEDLEPLIDDVAVCLEKVEPGRAQGVLGVTKLKYIGLADRVSMLGSLQSSFPRDEAREIMAMPFKADFIVRAAAIVSRMAESGSTIVLVMLYDQEEIWGPNEKLIPNAGMLTFHKGGAFGAGWHVEVSGGGTAEEPPQKKSNDPVTAKTSASEYAWAIFLLGLLAAVVVGLVHLANRRPSLTAVQQAPSSQPDAASQPGTPAAAPLEVPSAPVGSIVPAPPVREPGLPSNAGLPTEEASLLAYWPLSDSPNDSRGANNGTASDIAYGMNAGRFTAHFNGEDSVVAYPRDVVSPAMTISAWIYPTATSTTMGIIEDVNNTGRNQGGFIFGLGGNGATEQVSFAVYPGGQAVNGGTVPANEWSFVAATFDGIHATIYVNGIAVSTGTGNLTTNVSSGYKYIGEWYAWSGDTPHYFQGCISDVGIFSRALTPSEISRLYSLGGLPAQGPEQASQRDQGIVSRAMVVSRGFTFDDQPRPMCPINGSGGPCTVEAFAGGEWHGDQSGYTCAKLDRATYMGSCAGGRLQGVSVVIADGTSKQTKEAFLSYFSDGRIAYPALTTWLDPNQPDSFGVQEEDIIYGCVVFGRWDETRTRRGCPLLMNAYGSDIFDESNVERLRNGTFDLNDFAARFMTYILGR